MRFWQVLRYIGIFLVLLSCAQWLPLLLALAYDDGQWRTFTLSWSASACLGVLLWMPWKPYTYKLRVRDGFLVVSLFWIVLGVLSGLPFVLGLGADFADAVFESVSGFTTTGATVLVGLDAMPPSILFYRQQLQWLGGIGVIVSAVALLPLLGVGGMQLLKAETSGPMKDEKLTPRITSTARHLWSIYAGFTVLCAGAYWIGGMSPFDAVGHAFATVSTGGFSTHDASFGYFDSAWIEAVAIVFMLLGAVSFNCHFLFARTLSWRAYADNVEVRAFALVVAAVIALTALLLTVERYTANGWEGLRLAAFTVTSVITTTGFGVSDFSMWPSLLPVLMICISCMAGCAGSTSGGIKVIRFVVLGAQGRLLVLRLIHPNLERSVMLNGRILPLRVVDAVWGFFAVYVVVYAAMMLLLMAGGMDQVSAFGAVAASLNNLGPGLGSVSTTFAAESDFTKWLMSLAMLLGRLEIFPLLVVLHPAYWRS